MQQKQAKDIRVRRTWYL